MSHSHQVIHSHVIFKLNVSLSPQGVSTSVLCHDVVWLTEELLFRNKDVGFGGSLENVLHYSLSLLAPHLIIAAVPSGLVSCFHYYLYTAKCCSLSNNQLSSQ